MHDNNNAQHIEYIKLYKLSRFLTFILNSARLQHTTVFDSGHMDNINLYESSWEMIEKIELENENNFSRVLQQKDKVRLVENDYWRLFVTSKTT